jgi:hypothetical protein
MKLDMTTKYNIGDTVWFADYFYDTFYPCKYPGIISEVEIEITKTQQIISYWVVIDYDGNKEVQKYTEVACFATYEECTKWCDERNKSL